MNNDEKKAAKLLWRIIAIILAIVFACLFILGPDYSGNSFKP